MIATKDNNCSTGRSGTGNANGTKSVEMPFMLSIMRTLKEHFRSINKTHYDDKAPVEELFNLLHQLLNCYLQLNLPVKSKQNFIKASTSITNTLKNEITLFLDNHFLKESDIPSYNDNPNTNNIPSHIAQTNNSYFTLLNISKEISLMLIHGNVNGNNIDTFLNCNELSNEDIIEKIKQKIDKKNIDLPLQITPSPNNQDNVNSNSNLKPSNTKPIYNTQSTFTPIKDIKPRSYHNKQQSLNMNSANVNNQKNKKSSKAAKSNSMNMNETPVPNTTTSTHIKERTQSVPSKKDKTKQMIPSNEISSNNKNTTQSTQHNTIHNINVNVHNANKHKATSKKTSTKDAASSTSNINSSLDKRNNLNHSFNHSAHSHRHYSVPSQHNGNNNHLRTFSNTSTSLTKQTKPKKDEPVLTTTTIVTQQNPGTQQDKTNTSLNDNTKMNSTFLCTTVKSGNIVQKYTLNTKANQNVPKASRYANSLLDKYKGLIAAYNGGQIPNKK